MQDTNRLALLINTHLVFYWSVPSKTPQQSPTLVYARDFRQDFDLPACRYFVLDKNFTIKESNSSLDHLVDHSNYYFARPNSSSSNSSHMINTIAKVCNLPLPPFASTNCEKIYELERVSGALFDFWQKTIMVVGYKGCRGKLPRDWKNYVKPSKCLLEVHCLIAPKDQKSSMRQLNLQDVDYVICNFGQTHWCQLKEPFYLELLKNCRTKKNEDVLRDKVETLEVGRGGVNYLAHSSAEQEKSKLEKKLKKIQAQKNRVNGCDKIQRFCRCDICSLETAYTDNMSRSGPEKLLTRNLSIEELLKILGQNSQQNCQILEELSCLSVAAFDIESTTIKLDHTEPAKNLPQAELDSSLKGQHNLALQKPIMLAHRDGLMDENELCPVFTLAGNEESDIYQLVRDYWKFVRLRQKMCASRKRCVAQSLLDLLEDYENAYLKLAKDWIDPFFEGGKKKLAASEIMTGWRFSVPGRLKIQLNILIERYEVFSFYGSGYDQVLLTNYLVPYLFEKRFKPVIEKNGNKVNVIKVKKCHVNFRDVVKLLSPGTSLKQFGQLFNLQQAKAHFPFALLTGVEALELPLLPSNLSEWQSELSSSKNPLTLEDVAEAHRLFRMSNCQNVGDYLKTYLRLDVDILYKATQGWRQTIIAEIGVDFVQTAKFTISSVSNFAGDLCASKNLQIGQFFPNSSAVYRLLRRGMRG